MDDFINILNDHAKSTTNPSNHAHSNNYQSTHPFPNGSSTAPDLAADPHTVPDAEPDMNAVFASLSLLNSSLATEQQSNIHPSKASPPRILSTQEIIAQKTGCHDMDRIQATLQYLNNDMDATIAVIKSEMSHSQLSVTEVPPKPHTPTDERSNHQSDSASQPQPQPEHNHSKDVKPESAEQAKNNDSNEDTTTNSTDTDVKNEPFSSAKKSANASLDDLMSVLSPPDAAHESKSNAKEQPKEKEPTPPPPKTTVTINVRTLTGEKLQYEMEPDDTVKRIKLHIFEEHKIWPQHQRLVYGGDVLTDKHTLDMLEIRNNAILYMVLNTTCSTTEPPKTIWVQKLNGDVFQISCTSADSVQTLKRTIQNQEGYDMESQILVFRNDRMENMKSLGDYNIQNNCMLKMMLRNTRFDNIKDDDDDDEVAVPDSVDDAEEEKLQPFNPQFQTPSAAPSTHKQAPIQPLPSSAPIPNAVSKPAQSVLPPPPPPLPQPDEATVSPTSKPDEPAAGDSSASAGTVAPSHPLELTKEEKEKQKQKEKDAKKEDDIPPEAKASIASAPDVPALSPSNSKKTHASQSDSAKATAPSTAPADAKGDGNAATAKWKVGDVCYRKGKECVIKAIDYHTNPPSVTVALTSDSDREINTEFHLLSKVAPQITKTNDKPASTDTAASTAAAAKANGVGETPKKPAPSSTSKAVADRPASSSSSSPSHTAPSSASPTRHSNGKGLVPARTQSFKQHLFSPSMINQLMALNAIKYVGGGLRNLGNSCFMNSTLQCLTYTQVFQNYIYQQMHTRMCTARSQRQVCFMCELHDLLPQIINRGGSVIVPSRMFNYLPYLSNSLVPGRQEDAHEFWTALVKHMQAAAIRPHTERYPGKKMPIALQETSVMYKIFGGYLRSQILCTACNKASNTYDSILDLSLEIRGCRSVVSALQKFTTQEKLIDDNKYFCAQCNRKQNAVKQLTIFDAPNILLLHLKRFEFGVKIDKFVQFDTSLDLTPFMSKYRKFREKGRKITYTLYAVLIHAGKYSNCGHYYSYIRTANNKWYLCNDSTIKSSTTHNVLQQNGYMFFYQRDSTKQKYVA
eukprot:CAMPEP_0197080238 /NCGR_PEP_ID=MMETSP1384-20130603/214025_1 /TAXON_ID=29189 /ORGANISM="Ammonia sp." /LENGTH=1078 /DNA_ID=CAMNT_0042519121 /DNA_START=1 /DNA_END=3237 /DNA_ORIENTATION=+